MSLLRGDGQHQRRVGHLRPVRQWRTDWAKTFRSLRGHAAPRHQARGRLQRSRADALRELRRNDRARGLYHLAMQEGDRHGGWPGVLQRVAEKMKYIANPVEVEAYIIVNTVGDTILPDGSMQLHLQNGAVRTATKGMIARYIPKEGDYYVVQSDGYVYVNPKAVFERNYRPAQ